MMEKKLALFLLVPLLAFMIVPMATANARVPNIQLFVHCYTYEGTTIGTTGKVTFHGVTVSVNCPANGSEYTNTVCIYAGSPTSFKVTTTAGAARFTQTGTFGPHMGAINGHQYGDDFGTYVEWFLGTPPVNCGEV